MILYSKKDIFTLF